MGLWWEECHAVPSQDKARFASFEGDPKAIPKRFPIAWRFQHNWAMLRVFTNEPFYLFFNDIGGTMRRRKLIEKSWVFVRIGPGPVVFWAKDQQGNFLEIKFDGRWLQRTVRTSCQGKSISPGAVDHYKRTSTFA